MSQKIKVLLVDDHPLVREGLVNLISQQADLQICGEAGNEPQALELIRTVQPDVAIVDISLENGSGIELIKSIKAMFPTVTVLVLSMHDESLYAERALRAGARGYVMKREAAKKVIEAIRCVLAGQLYVSDKIAALMAEKFVEGRTAATASPIEQLSNRELEVFQLLGLGTTRGRLPTTCTLVSKPSRLTAPASRKSSSWPTPPNFCAKPSAGRKASRQNNSSACRISPYKKNRLRSTVFPSPGD
jgi:DNA-binding NarL/FixJ family response regulator